MRVLVLGGSNSVGDSGYVGYVKKHYESISGKTLEIVNLSIGGGSTLSGAARLHETFESVGTCDVILYEYGVNDALTFRRSDDATAYFRRSLQIFVESAATFYPNARLVPIALTHQHWYSPEKSEPVREERAILFKELGVEEIDVGGWFHRLFEGHCPDFLYSDPAHYGKPSMSHLVGSFVAERLRWFLDAGAGPSLRQILASFRQLPHWQPVNFRYLPARELHGMVDQRAELLKFENRLLSTEVLRLRSGSTLSFNGCSPLLMTLKSDGDHGFVKSKFGDHEVDFSTVFDGAGRLPWVYWSVSVPVGSNIPFSAIFGPNTRHRASFTVDETLSSGTVLESFQQPIGPGKLLDIIGILALTDPPRSPLKLSLPTWATDLLPKPSPQVNIALST